MRRTRPSALSLAICHSTPLRLMPINSAISSAETFEFCAMSSRIFALVFAPVFTVVVGDFSVEPGSPVGATRARYSGAKGKSRRTSLASQRRMGSGAPAARQASKIRRIRSRSRRSGRRRWAGLRGVLGHRPGRRPRRRRCARSPGDRPARWRSRTPSADTRRATTPSIRCAGIRGAWSGSVAVRIRPRPSSPNG